MILQTKYFGEVQFDEAEILKFPSGLFGFEDETSFLLIPFQDENDSLLCLQSTQTSSLAFLVMNPFFLSADYAPVPQAAELSTMGVQTSHELCYYVLCAAREPIHESTVNLRCPILINEDSRIAMQIILDSDVYTMRHPLSEFQAKEGGGTC